MSETTTVPDLRRAPARLRTRRPSILRTRVLARLEGIEWGRITIREDGPPKSFGPDADGAPGVSIRVHDSAFWAALALRGPLGAGESYMAGDWSCDDLVGLVRILVRNEAILRRVEGGLARLAIPALRLYHRLRRNTRIGSRENIAAHYDLGNDFYRLFLDETMTYSSGVFPHAGASLAEAQTAKMDRLLDALAPGPDDHLLEIGSGWGSFAIRAAERTGCRVTATTISAEQLALARERVRDRGLEDRITLLSCDYRDLEGTFDRVVSIEMIEAVGHEHLETFVRTCAERLAPDGLLALQAITIADQRYARHVRSVDFIKRYIFPGSCLVSVTALAETATRATDLRLVSLDDIGAHYVRTLRLWRERFLANVDAVRRLGFDESFIRRWEYYLAYCEGAFAERWIGDVHAIFAKPMWRDAAITGDGNGSG